MSVDTRRVEHRAGNPNHKGTVVYWMQQSQRLRYNPAFELARELAIQRSQALWVIFILMPDVPEANVRHYRFMSQGLYECAQSFKEMGIEFFMGIGKPAAIIPKLEDQISVLVMDKGYLNWQREIREQVQQGLPHLDIYEVEADVIVPVQTTSSKEEYAAATIRPKLLKMLPYDLDFADHTIPSSDLRPLSSKPGEQFIEMDRFASETELWKLILDSIHADDSVSAVSHFTGGYSQAIKRLDLFVTQRVNGYAEFRNHPGLQHYSDLSPYLHFGQISPMEITLRVLQQFDRNPEDIAGLIRGKETLDQRFRDLASFLEELIVRRELSCNFCHFNHAYDEFSSLPSWARATLYDHLDDPRPFDYSLDRLENAQTDDPYWNLAQQEMLMTGKMNNYMRMYWGKKLIEWLPDPELAFRLMLWLNNRYELDGRDPNTYAGVAWCFGKHDRPWQSRSIFGSVRYMNKAGLDRKFDMRLYASRIEELNIG